MVIWLDRVALALTLVLPVFVMHGRGIADGMIAAVGLLFLLRSVLTGRWGWVRTPWLVVGWVWWAWLVLCSVPGIGSGGGISQVQAVVL